MKKIILAVLVVLSAAVIYAASRPKQPVADNAVNAQAQTGVKEEPAKTAPKKYKVTFVELGSVRCIPCKMMVPVMKEVEERCGDQVKVLFYDVWTAEGRPYAAKYNVGGIPTQVFLDENGKEFYRHVGFYPKDELFEMLKKQGVNIK